MTMSNNSSVLKDVVAYVDVWSSDKTANYSKPFVQQLQEMGAQVSKTFNKQVTHVVFNNGHPATWGKAKKRGVRLVSVLWVGRCYDDGVRVDEESYPALNDESNPVLKKKKHRCMQPKDSPERTPENNTRMKKKLDKMMKDLLPKQPLVTDVSPIIIDEENGIVYSPALKRSDYMAQRLRDMKEKRENLSPTASQMVESCSPTGLKPSLGSTPTVCKLMYDESDDDSSASVAEPAYSPDKEEGRTQVDVTDHRRVEQRQRKGCEKLWLSPCHDVPKRISSPVKCPDLNDFKDFKDEEGKSKKKSGRTPVRKKQTVKQKLISIESPCQDRRSDNSKNVDKEKRKSQVKSSNTSANKSKKGKQNMKVDKSSTETHFSFSPTDSSHRLSTTLGDAAAEMSKETAAPLYRTPKPAQPSFSALVRSFTLSSDSKSVASCSTDRGDDVFEDFFSPANCHRSTKRHVLPNLSLESGVQIPFELDSVPKKRKLRRSESLGSEINSKKKRKVEQSSKNRSQQSDASIEPHRQAQQDVKGSLPSFDSQTANASLVAKRQRQSTLPFTNTTTKDAIKQRGASTSAHLTLLTETDAVPEPQTDSVTVVSHTLESE